ncbi:MAG: hypothetical protein CO103_03400 [Chloroflexi bacterium CG_4_9_14_3_um_filter_45_9]|nr:MAG: hypothetical protein COT13_01070 [Chloroflexi bacterium CG08_land_8_20_14_0_20_45_12]PIX27400.1 MAG: hypothetical protein COZ67_02455 [Chloroflexi bacterium CG_4_8_14_3_um_filter_45_15]PJB50103.1 MAG: hypothetical protein CO103_03400 [Chloroflexi bacterium CG_4_9_14_3_um_filter_45_9]
MNTFNPKKLLIETLRNQYQIELIRGSDVIALNSKAILYIRYNKNAGATKNLIGKFWFGITKSEYEKYSNHNFFIACACVFGPGEIDYLIFPSDRFDEIKKDIALQSGQWKFNLLKTDEKRYHLQIPKKGKYDVTEFLNYFDFSPREFRRAYSPELGEFQPKVTKGEILAIPKKPMPLEEELLMTVKDSSNPQNFELALEKFFTEIGFPCKRIGGPGETDILVLEPVKFVVDGKSTKADAKSAINFTRIKRHMKESNGEFMVIVSVGFDPAVGKDAEIEGATLIDIQTLITVLKIHREYVLSPFDYIEILRQHGMVTGEKIGPLRQKIEHQINMLNKSMILLENLDFTPRNIDEIKGRIDLYCEQNQILKIERNEIESLLIFLSHDLLRIVNQKDNKFSLWFTPPLSKEKLKSTIRMLCTKPLEVE